MYRFLDIYNIHKYIYSHLTLQGDTRYPEECGDAGVLREGLRRPAKDRL